MSLWSPPNPDSNFIMPGQVLGQGTVRPDSDTNDTEILIHKLHSKKTSIIADTLHFETLSIHDFDGTMFNLKQVFQALTARELDYYLWVAAKRVFDLSSGARPSQKRKNRQQHILKVREHFMLELAKAIGDRVTGPHVAFVDPRVHDDTWKLVKSAQRMYDLFHNHGVARDNFMVSIPATEAGIYATRYLKLNEKNINVNLYLVTSLMHAAACVEAGAAAISVPVGPLLKMYESKRRISTRVELSKQYPGIEAIQTILEYFKHNDIPTRTIGVGFRTTAEIDLFSDFDVVCVSQNQADRLRCRVPITSPTELTGTHTRARFRGKQAQHPTNLLTKQGGFSTWFSPESRKFTTELIEGALRAMGKQMNVLDDFVEVEVMQQFELDTMPLREVLRLRREATEPDLGTRGETMIVDDHFATTGAPKEFPSTSSQQNMDEMF